MKAKTTGALTIIAVAAMLVLVFAFWRAAAVEAVYPVERAKRSLTQRVFARMRGIWDGAAACAENERLRRMCDTLAMACADRDALEAENARLRKALDFRNRQRGRWVAAGVLSQDGGAAGARRTLRVDRGSAAGVGVGQIVRVPEGLVGRVISVTPHTAEISLIVDASLRVACTLEGHAKSFGILSGGTEERLLLRHLRGGATIAPRTRVLTSGLGGVFPAGIPVGTLLRETTGAQDVARQGEVQPAVDFTTLEDVFIRCAE